jgi:hypothetical protein
MKSMLRHALQVSALSAGLVALAATPALAQGRSRDVPPGIAKNGKCPPGLAKQGRCGNGQYDNRDVRYDDRYDRGRNDTYDDRIRTRPNGSDPIRTRTDADRCWDRNRDGRCDYTTARREADWCWDRNRDGRCDTANTSRVYDRVDRRVDPREGTTDRENGSYIDRTIGDLIDRARQERRSP